MSLEHMELRRVRDWTGWSCSWQAVAHLALADASISTSLGTESACENVLVLLEYYQEGKVSRRARLK